MNKKSKMEIKTETGNTTRQKSKKKNIRKQN